nr:zinc finger, BED-type [Tanacetum cinerariifolium]
MEKNKRRKARDHEVLLAQEAGEAQEWIVEGEVCEDGVEGGLPRETVSDDMGTRTSARLRELYEEEFESEGEVEVDEEIEYESNGVQIIEQYYPTKMEHQSSISVFVFEVTEVMDIKEKDNNEAKTG